VYPIKVNQQHHVVAELSEFGRALGFGLEVGSKPELLAVMALTTPSPEQLIICNGFKDAQYIEAVILSGKLGRAIVPVVENIEELQLIIRYAEKYGVRPKIGVRVKLAASGAGRWKESSGTRSKFGLFVSELLDMVEMLESHGMLDCLELLHCHNGSQVHDIRNVKAAVTELTHIYLELKRLGATGLTMIDIGGGLAVDYRGDQSNSESSMNYTVEEFASDVVYRIGSICDSMEVPHPTIVTECGRAMVAYSTVLVFNVLGSTGPRKFARPPEVEEYEAMWGEGSEIPQPILDLREALDSVSEDRLLECYHDAQQARDQVMSLFSLGYLSLPMRALAERLFWSTCARIRAVRDRVADTSEELLELDEVLSDVYFGNFSLFQSLPDSWAIDQLFPIMPIHRLDERPKRKAIFADVTCDSDGKIDNFIGEGETHHTIDVHPLDEHDYYIGVFLVGAYQETLGDLHNLFGDAHAVHIRVEDGSWSIEEIVKGDTSKEVLGYVQYDTSGFLKQMAQDCERAVRAGRLSAAETKRLMEFYENGLNSYTYLSADGE
jgi:arginine decarboxylase